MAEVTIGEETFHIELEGDEGKPVILLSNALGTNLSMWDAQMPALLEHYRVLRYDSRGHGESSVPDGPYTINLLGQDVLGILDALGLEQVDFIGLSLGGFIGQWLMLHAPERIGKAVLSNTASQIGNEDMWNDRIQTAFHDGMAPIASGLVEAWFTREFREKDAAEVSRIEKMILATQTEGYTATCAALRDADLRNEIAEIKTPVLVIVGRHDIVTPTGIGALIASAIDGAKLVTLDAAHLSNVGDPEEFNKEALAFLVGEGTSAVMEEPVMAEEDDVIVEETTIEVPPETKAEAKPKAPRKPRVKKAPVEDAVHSDEPEHAAAEPADEPAPEEASEPEEPVVLAPKPKKPRAKKAPKAVEAAPEPLPVDDDPPGENAEADDFAEPEPAPKRAARRAPVKKAAAKKAPVKKAAAKKVAAKKAPAKKAAATKAPAKKAAVKKAAAKKVLAKKAPVKKAAAKKAAVKKTAVKSSARKAVGKTSPVKKVAVKKAAVKKTAARKGAIKVAAKKTAVKKAAVKKSAVKKSAVKKSVAKKAAVKKTAVKKTAAKKTAVKKTAFRAAPKKAVKKAPARKTAAKKAKRR